MTTEFEWLLAAVMESACKQAQALAAHEDGLPRKEVRHLGRPEGYLKEVTASELNWRQLSADLEETPGLQSRLSQAVEVLEQGQLIRGLISNDELLEPVDMLWQFVVVPVLKCYQTLHENWEWDEGAALRSIAEWLEAVESRAEGSHRTMAPLLWFEGPDEAISLGGGVEIRPFTDDDREALWHTYGEDRLSPGVLHEWTHVIDYRWMGFPEDSPLGHGPGMEVVMDVVRALRLHHSGMVEAAIIWTCPYPPDEPGGFFHRSYMTSRADRRFDSLSYATVFGGSHSLKTLVGTKDAEDLIRLLQGLRERHDDRRLDLALRRFDLAYSRHNNEDRLLDLWIAFEALLLPDGRSELSYRAALRIALLAAEDAATRKEAFRQARLSYNSRSQVVHGEALKTDLEMVVNETRELARKALRAWVLNPPANGIEEIDELLFD